MRLAGQIRSLLQHGDLRTVGHVAEVVRAVLEDSQQLSSLVECAFDDDAGIRMRAGDALEKVSRAQTEELQRYVGVLIGLFEETEQPELLWHLAVLLPRLRLNAAERRRVGQALQRCLQAKSSIVRTFALQGLADLMAQERSLEPLVLDLLKTAEREGSPAMKARSRRLLRRLNGHVEEARGPTRRS